MSEYSMGLTQGALGEVSAPQVFEEEVVKLASSDRTLSGALVTCPVRERGAPA